MKKTIISALALILAAMCITASGCSCDGVKQTGTAYGLVHGYYVGQATVERSGDKIVSVKFEETEGPSSWAKRTNIKDEKADGVETGATLVDFHDYMGLAVRAFESAQ